MDITPFYELKNRLYNAAIAGCGIIPEDFRLKRAIEGLQPLAEKGKVFAGLQKKCEGLFVRGADVATVLSDCIALADAIAVTLATTGYVKADLQEAQKSGDTVVEDGHSFNDVTLPSRISVKEIPYSTLAEIDAKFKKGGEGLWGIQKMYPEALADIRVASKFVENINHSSVYYDKFAVTMMEIYGESLVPALKNSIDLADPKAGGKQVTYVAAVSGAKERDWYLSLAKDENCPQQVRIRAIRALGLDASNEAALMELYQTEKGKIKAAAILALTEMDAQGIQPYLQKICAAGKSTGEDYIELSPNAICTDYAVKRAQTYLDDLQYSARLNLLANKTRPGVEEGYFALLNATKKQASLMQGKKDSNTPFYFANYTENMKDMLENTAISNLFKDIPGAGELIDRLYVAQPDVFALANVLRKLLSGSLELQDFRQSGRDPYQLAEKLASKILVIPFSNEYRMTWEKEYTRRAKKIGEHYPEVLLKVFTDKDFFHKYLALKSYFTAKNCCEKLVYLFYSSLPLKERVRSSALDRETRYEAGAWDHDTIKEYAMPFLKAAVKKYPGLYYEANIYLILPDTEDRADRLWETILSNLNQNRLYYDHYLERSEEQRLKELEYAIHALECGQAKVEKTLVGRQLTILKNERDRLK